MSYETREETLRAERDGDSCDLCGEHGNCDDKVRRDSNGDLLHESCKRKIDATHPILNSYEK